MFLDKFRALSYRVFSNGTTAIADDATGNGAWSASVDTREITGLSFICEVPSTVADDVAVAIALQESDDNTTFSDVADSDTGEGEQRSATAGKSVAASYIGQKRYVRARLEATNTSGASVTLAANEVQAVALYCPEVDPIR